MHTEHTDDSLPQETSDISNGAKKSIFSKIIDREIPAEIIYEDEDTIVIPDKFPSVEGQLLVITKKQVPYVFDLDHTTYDALMHTTKRVARALDTALHTLRTCVVIEGFEVPHVHVRLYPTTTEQLSFTPRVEKSDEELAKLAEKVRSALTDRA